MKLLQLLLVACACFLTGWLGLHVPFTGTHTPLVWLPAGIAVAALIMYGRYVWPGIFLGVLPVYLMAGFGWMPALQVATSATLAPVVCVAALLRWKFHADFGRTRDVAVFVLASMVGMLVSSASGVLIRKLSGVLPTSDLIASWFSWWMGDVLGVLLVAPVLLTINLDNLRRLSRLRYELMFWLAFALPVGAFAFMQNSGGQGQTLPLAFVALLLLVWAALSFGVTGSGLAGLGFSLLALYGTATQHGTFYFPDPYISLFLLWAFMICTVLTGLLITALQTERIRSEKSLRENQRQMRELAQSRQAILDGTTFAIISTDPQGIVRNFNAGAERMLGYTAAEMVDKKSPLILHDRNEIIRRAAKLSKELGKPVVPGFETLVAKVRHKHTPDEFEWTYIKKDGTRFPVLLSVSALVNSKNELTGYMGIGIDRTEYRRQENLIRDSEELFRVLYESSTEAHMLVTKDKGFMGANQAAVKLFGCTDLEQFLLLSPATTSPEFQSDGRRSDALVNEMMDLALENGSHAFEWIYQRADQSRFYAEVLLTQIHIGGKDIVHAIVRDISLRKASDEEISKLAFYDSLTGLPNRRLLMDRLKVTLGSSTRYGREGALMFIDLDHFKNLNDTLGHDMGDLLLQEVASRLTQCVRKIDTVARLGGDEFVVMVNDLSEELNEAAQQVEKVGVKILNSLNQPYVLNGNSYRNTPSVGVTMFSNCNDNISELMKQADLAMYQAKATGRNNLQFFDAKIQQIVNAHVELESGLRDALVHDQFELYYQPQMDARLNLTGVEVLIRWRHPVRDLISPTLFISVAESTGLINPIGAWVLESACRQLALWASHPQRSHLTVSVNVSAIQFCSVNYVEQVTEVIRRTGADPSRLKLEITESILLDDVEIIIAKMQKLQKFGISFSLDDFGTGYSSLAYLKRLPLSQLKIDQSFVRDVLSDPNDATFARTIITLGQSLGLNVIAEGVETEEQLKFLSDHHCNGFQGFWFSKPLPLAEFEQYMDNRRDDRAGQEVMPLSERYKS